MPPPELAAIIQNPLDEIHVLYVDGTPAGFGELDRRQPDEIEIKQFGLVPLYLGRGLGKWFLQELVDRAWNHKPRRVWLHTCTLDHAAALPNYQKIGFEVYKQEQIQQPIG